MLLPVLQAVFHLSDVSGDSFRTLSSGAEPLDMIGQAVEPVLFFKDLGIGPLKVGPGGLKGQHRSPNRRALLMFQG